MHENVEDATPPAVSSKELDETFEYDPSKRLRSPPPSYSSDTDGNTNSWNSDSLSSILTPSESDLSEIRTPGLKTAALPDATGNDTSPLKIPVFGSPIESTVMLGKYKLGESPKNRIEPGFISPHLPSGRTSRYGSFSKSSTPSPSESVHRTRRILSSRADHPPVSPVEDDTDASADLAVSSHVNPQSFASSRAHEDRPRKAVPSTRWGKVRPRRTSDGMSPPPPPLPPPSRAIRRTDSTVFVRKELPSPPSLLKRSSSSTSSASSTSSSSKLNPLAAIFQPRLRSPSLPTLPLRSEPELSGDTTLEEKPESQHPHIVIQSENGETVPLDAAQSPKSSIPRTDSWMLKMTLPISSPHYPFIPKGDIVTPTTPVAGGGYCDVYKGELEKDGTTQFVALKHMRVFSNMTEDDIRVKSDMFQREVHVWARLRHPNVLPFWGCYKLDERRLFMVSPWATHGNASQYVKNHPKADRLRILCQTAEALVYLHSGKDIPALVHGDLKADNVLISETGDALLADFGLTRCAEKLGFLSATPSAFAPMGNIRFAAPELLEPSARPSRESDVYAFAMLTVQLYTDALPFSGMNDIQVLKMISSQQTPTRPSESDLKGPGFCDRLWGLIKDCCNPVSERPSMQQVAERVKVLCAAL